LTKVDQSTGQLERSVPIFELAGATNDTGESSTGNVTYEALTFLLQGTSIDFGDSVEGSIEGDLLFFGLSGSTIDLGEEASGSLLYHTFKSREVAKLKSFIFNQSAHTSYTNSEISIYSTAYESILLNSVISNELTTTSKVVQDISIKSKIL